MSLPTPGQGRGDVMEIRRTRVAVFVGDANTSLADGEPDGTELDFALPATRKLIAVVEDLKDAVEDELRRRRLPRLDPKASYVLCDADGRPFDLEMTLDQCEVYDGYSVWLLPQEASERHSRVIERVSTAIARSADAQFRVVDPEVTRRMTSVLLVALVGWAALILAKLWWDTGSWIPAAACGGLAVALVGGVGLPRARRVKIAAGWRVRWRGRRCSRPRRRPRWLFRVRRVGGMLPPGPGLWCLACGCCPS